MNYIKFIFIITLALVFFNGCTAFKNDYKPLYQAKPKIENLEKI